VIGTALVSRAVAKEFRALAIPWLACAAATIVPTLVQGPQYVGGVQVVAYFVGATVLGALSVGHEYVDRTLSLLLCLPVRRERLLLVKLGVLAAMLTPLGVVAYAYVFKDLDHAARLAFSLLPVLGGLFIAPGLTMASRSPVAGAALTLAVPGVWSIVAAWIGSAAAFTTAFTWGVPSVICAIGAVLSWRTFMRLEATGSIEDLQLPQWPPMGAAVLRRGSGRGEHLSNPATSASLSPVTRHPIWQLAAKEVRLQQPAFFVAGIYLLGWVGVRLSGDAYRDLYVALSGIYAAFLGVLVGAVASAEERQLGTIEWQVLQPVALWRQWAVKLGVVMGLVMLMGVGLPALLASLAPATTPQPVVRLPLANMVIPLALGGLYVSSLCQSGGLALAISFPAAFGALWFQIVVLGHLSAAAHPAWSGVFNESGRSGGYLLGSDASRVLYLLDLLLLAGFFGMVARLALTNHRSAERPRWRIAGQAAMMAAFAAARVVILSGAAAFFGRNW
jgi:hypothetical protein